MSKLKEQYINEVKPALQEKFGYKNPMQLPKVTKVVVNMGVAEGAKDKNIINDCVREMEVITGQRPIMTKARKSISNFKLREGQVIGVKTTLRGERMYDFMYRFFNIVCPRIRDFRGFALKCDGQGNYTLGINDQQIFPEINLDEVKRTQGMHITFVTTANTDDECVELLKSLGLPFMRDAKV
ncbi:MAG: 50S ribosomal protein L5 [Chlamydiota bacterium]